MKFKINRNPVGKQIPTVGQTFTTNGAFSVYIRVCDSVNRIMELEENGKYIVGFNLSSGGLTRFKIADTAFILLETKEEVIEFREI